MGNILIHSLGEGLRTIDVQLIDWNLVTFYYKGFESNEKKGTECYYPPEILLRTNYVTPAIDIWSLAVVYFTFVTDKKPFPLSCKTNNL
jgi:serine/threonine protein kinase